MVGFVGQVIIKGADRGDFPSSGCGIKAIIRIPAVLEPNPIPAEVGHVAVDVRQGDAGHKVQVHIHNVDLVQLLFGEGRVTDLLHVAEEIPQIQIVFVHSPFGMGFDGFVIRQKVPQDLRCFGAVIVHDFVPVYLRFGAVV